MCFKDIKTDFETNSNKWKEIYDSSKPHLAIFPDPWDERLNYFQKCLVLRLLRYDKIIPAIRHFVACKYIKNHTNLSDVNTGLK